MNTVIMPWTAESVLITWRTVSQKKRPPLPSEFLATFVLYGTLSVVGTRQPGIAAAVGWGVVVATFLRLYSIDERLTTLGKTASKPAATTAKKG